MKVTGRSLLLWIFTLAFVGLVFVEADAQTYFVATNGNDGSAGTAGAAWRTIGYAVSRLKAGDTLYIRGGTYTGSENTINDGLRDVPSGTSWANPITIAGYPSEAVTILHPDGTEGVHLAQSAHSYIIFQDLTIDGSLGFTSNITAIVYLQSAQHHIRFNRVEIKNAWVSGINLYTSGGFNEFLNCSVHGNGRQPDTGAGGGGNSGYGIYVVSSDNLFDGLDIYGNHGYGFYVNQHRNTLRNSRIHGNGVILGAGQSLGTNYGVDIGAGAYGSSVGNFIYNNLIYGNRGGILVYTHSADTHVYHNTIYGNLGGAIDVQYVNGDVSIRNNILFGNGLNAITNNGGFSGGSIIQDHNLLTNPSFVNSATNDFQLQSGSAARNAGTPLAIVTHDLAGVSRQQDNAPDIGAYEYSQAPRVPGGFRIQE